MLKKLLKYDIKSYASTTLPLFGLALLLAVFSRIFTQLNDITPILRVPTELVNVLSILMTNALPFIIFAIGIEKFNKQITKDEGYLTHTLPVKKQIIITSKLITQTLFQIGSLIVLFASMCIIENIKLNTIINFIKSIKVFITQYSVITPTLILLIIIAEYAVINLLIFTAISFGQKHSTNKSKFAILYGIILYIIQQFVTAIIYMPLFKNKQWLNELEKTFPDKTVLNVVLVIGLSALLITSIVYYILTTKNLEKKLNLE